MMSMRVRAAPRERAVIHDDDDLTWEHALLVAEWPGVWTSHQPEGTGADSTEIELSSFERDSSSCLDSTTSKGKRTRKIEPIATTRLREISRSSLMYHPGPGLSSRHGPASEVRSHTAHFASKRNADCFRNSEIESRIWRAEDPRKLNR